MMTEGLTLEVRADISHFEQSLASLEARLGQVSSTVEKLGQSLNTLAGQAENIDRLLTRQPAASLSVDRLVEQVGNALRELEVGVYG